MDTSDLSTNLPRYQRLCAQLAREIGDGVYPVGSFLPSEPQLCARFGVSRHTLREAVRKLCEQGLVARHQGIGTRVLAARPTPQRYVAALGSLHELMQYTQRTRLVLLGSRERVADEPMARELQCRIGERWLEGEACRYPVPASDAPTDQAAPPLVHMLIYVRPEARGLFKDLARGDAWVFGLVEKYGGERIVEVRQVVGAMAMPARSGRLLGVRARSPALRVRRYYLGRGGRLLSVSVNLYPAERFELSTNWRLESDTQTA